MKRILLTTFRWFLLVCVVLNLGDAPYVDEILAEVSPSQTHLSVALSGDPGDQAIHGTSGQVKHSAYEHLLSHIPLPAGDITAAIIEPADEVPVSAAHFLPSPPAVRLERPPRTASRLA